MRTMRVAAPDGLGISAHAWGNPDGPAIVFIHGFNQCHLSWARQWGDAALARDFNMVALDLRGHGASDKPPEKERYTDDKAWADDIAAVIAAFELRRPVLVGWSYAGRVITDYVRFHGISDLAGINFVGAATVSDPKLMGIGGQLRAGMSGDDLAVNVASTRAFVRACFERQPESDEFEDMLAFNMVVPSQVRAHVMARSHNPGDVLPTLKLPVLVTHGSEDKLVLESMGRYTASAVPVARLSVYEGIGHAPFWEDAPRFNSELAEFVRSANPR